MQFNTEAERMTHPQAHLIPSSVWRDLFRRELSDEQLTLMQMNAAELSAHLQSAQFNDKPYRERLQAWIAIAVSQPALNKTELIQLGHQLNLNNEDLFPNACAVGNIELVNSIISGCTPDSVPAMIEAQDYEAFRVATRNGHLPVVHYLLQYPRVFAYAEAHMEDFGEQFVLPRVAETLAALHEQKDTFESEHPGERFDIPEEDANYCFYVLRSLIRQNKAEHLDDIRFLLDIPAVKAHVHNTATENQENELILLAREVGNTDALPLFRKPTLKERVQGAWSESVDRRLKAIDAPPEEVRLIKLQAFLASSWGFVKGTLLCYTADPRSEQTQRLIDLATEVADALNESVKRRVEGDIASKKSGWIALGNEYMNIRHQSVDTCKSRVQAIWPESLGPIPAAMRMPLQQHARLGPWVERVKGAIEKKDGLDDATKATLLAEVDSAFHEALPLEERYYSEREACCQLLEPEPYPDNPMLSFEVLIGALEAHVSDNPPYNALKILMPTVHQESFDERYESLSELSPEAVLESHVLSDDGAYLLPVHLLSHMAHDASDELLPNNPFYDVSKDSEGHERLTSTEFRRIQMHSPLTEAIADSKQNYERLMSEDRSLLSQLNLLVHHLALNDAHGGRGEQTDAAAGAYPAIINFKEFYDDLPADEKARIPEKLKEEIDKLLEFASNPEANVSATENLATCIGTRREEIYKAMTGHDELLSGISIGEAQQAELIGETVRNYQQAQRDLSTALDEHHYHEGHDDLGIPEAMLDDLDIEITINSPSDLKLLVDSLSAEELSGVFSRPEIKAQVAHQIMPLENFIIFIMETSAEKLPACLNTLQDEIKPLLNTVEDISALLISLERKKLEITLTALKPLTTHFFNEIYEYSNLIKHLSIEQAKQVIEVYKEEIRSRLISEGASEFGYFKYLLNPEQTKLMFEAVEDILPQCVTSATDFINIARSLDDTDYQTFYQAVIAQQDLSALIKTTDDFVKMLDALRGEDKEQFYQENREVMLSNIESAQDFETTMNTLKEEDKAAFYELHKHNLVALLEKVEDRYQKTGAFRSLWRALTASQQAEFYNAMEALLPAFIGNDALAFNQIYQLLDEAHQQRFHALMKPNLINMVQYAHDISVITGTMNQTQTAEFFNAVKDDLPRCVRKAEDFKTICENLSADQVHAFYLDIRHSVSNLIHTQYEVRDILNVLNSEDKADFYSQSKHQLKAVFHNLDIFDQARFLVDTLRQLGKEQALDCIEFLQEDLKPHGGPFLFRELLNISDEEIVSILYDAIREKIKDALPGLITTPRAFNLVMRHTLDPEEKNALYQNVKAKVPDFIRSARNCADVLRYLTPTQQSEVLEAVKHNIPTWLNEGENFAFITVFLSPEQRSALYHEFKEQIISADTRIDAKIILMHCLEPADNADFYAAIKGTLLSTCQDFRSFEVIAPFIDIEQQREFIEASKALIEQAPLERAVEFFTGVLDKLSPEKFAETYPMLQETLPANVSEALQEEISKTHVDAPNMREAMQGLRENTKDRAATPGGAPDEAQDSDESSSSLPGV